MEDRKIRFIDLFAGIGGFRIAFEREGYECVFSSEIDEHACNMYKENFGDDPYCDITKLDVSTIPDFDVLCAGFPCQAFSISGKQKGFYDDTRGTLFFDICRILENKKPKVFVLENVQNLEKHDKGNTLRVMISALQTLGYTVQYKVLNAKDFNVPQNRERIIIVGNRIGKFFDFNKIDKKPIESMKGFLDKSGNFEYLNSTEYTIIKQPKKQEKSGLIFIGYRNKKMRTVGVRPGTEHLSRVHKQPNRIYSIDGIHPTIASQETCGRYWIYDGNNVRKLTLSECYRFMGFPEKFKKIGSKAKLYERIGNSVCVNMIQEVAKQVKKQLFEEGEIIMNNPIQFLEDIYTEAEGIGNINEIELNSNQIKWVKDITDAEETSKGVFTALFSSITYKCLHPEQDVRYHKISLENGYSGRSFDTRFVTPLKSKQFYGAMKESGWLTRSIEQPYPFTLDFPGKINNKQVKNAFLQILNDIEENNEDPHTYLKAIIKFSLLNKSLEKINKDYKILVDQGKMKTFAYSKLVDELDGLSLKLSRLQDDLDYQLRSITSMKDDETRAREQLNTIEDLLKKSKYRLKDYKIPVIPSSYYIELTEAQDAIREIVKELDKKPIVIKILNIRVDTARDLVFKIYNKTNDMIKIVDMAEKMIVYGNRYRSSYEEIDIALTKAEELFRRGKYKESLDLSTKSISFIDKNIIDSD